jgi:hypothetical protein
VAKLATRRPQFETERDYFLLGVSSTTEVTENIEQAIKQAIKSVTGREMHVSVVEPLEEQLKRGSPERTPRSAITCRE